MPSCCSSHTVRRAPCSQGRVSPANTLPMRPMATPARITPSAVPKPAVASEPVLQWVSTPEPGAIRAAPSSPMCRFAARSSVSIACASASDALAPVGAGVGQAPRMRAIAHIRLTAVGREALSSSIAGCMRASAARPSAASTPVPGQHHALGGGDADRRRAAHDQVADGFAHLMAVAALQVFDLERQLALVEQRAARRPASGSGGCGRSGRSPCRGESCGPIAPV